MKVGISILITCIAFIILDVSEGICQQKVQFSQYMFNQLIINPAYAGGDEVLSVMLLHRNQWSGVDNAPSTVTLSAHTLFKNKNTGVGFLITNDKIGVHRDLGILGDYAYRLKLTSSTYLSMGIQVGVHNKKDDYASLIDPMYQDPKVLNATVSSTFVDFGTGIYFKSPKLNAGISVPQLMPERVSINDSVSLNFSRANYFGFAQYTFSASENTKLKPGMLIKYYANAPLSYDINLNVVFYEVLTFGFSYRKKESIDFLLRGKLTPQLDFGYSYDYPIGSIQNLSSGSHELMIHYLFKFVEKDTASPR